MAIYQDNTNKPTIPQNDAANPRTGYNYNTAQVQGYTIPDTKPHTATADYMASGGAPAITAAQKGAGVAAEPNNKLPLGSNWATADVRNHNGTNEVLGANGIDELANANGEKTPADYTGYTGGYAAPANPSYTAPTLPGATSQEAYINAMYDANRQAREDSLRNAYEQQVNVLNDQVNRLPGTYNAAADQVAAQAAIQQRNFNEQAAASGLNTGAGSQARLAQNNAYLGRISDVRRAQADAEANLNLQRAQLEAQYRNAIADAIAQNDLQRAQALYQEAVRVDESMVNTAINQANMNWQVWNALYNR